MHYKISFILLIVLFGCQTFNKSGDTTIQFDQNEIDLGVIKYKTPKRVNVDFTNTGEFSLVIFEVKTSCGCTVPEWTKKPTKSGNNGTISLLYDGNNFGKFRKTITVYYNGINSPDTLILKGEVEYPDEDK